MLVTLIKNLYINVSLIINKDNNMNKLEKTINLMYHNRFKWNTEINHRPFTAGMITFGQSGDLVKRGILNNETNRTVELVISSVYGGKAHHLIRYSCGISKKGCLEMSVLMDTPDESPVGYISDCGTFSSLAFRGGEFYSKKVLTPIRWIEILDDIEKEYPTAEKNKRFLGMVRDVVEGLPEAKMAIAISWEEIVNYNDEIKEYYFNVPRLNWKVSLWESQLHSLDMRNANNPDNKWEPFDFYVVPNKVDSRYHDVLCLEDIMNYVEEKPGCGKFTKKPDKSRRILGAFASKQENKRRKAKIRPLIHSFLMNKYCKNIDDLEEFYNKLHEYESYNDNAVYKYWNKDMYFSLLTDGVKYSEIIEFYNKYYKEVYSSNQWDSLDEWIQELEDSYKSIHNVDKCPDIKKFHHLGEAHGTFFIGYAIWAKKKYKLGIETTITKVITQYKTVLTGEVPVALQTMPLYEAFGSTNDYPANSASFRAENVFVPMMKAMDVVAKIKSKDRKQEEVLREKMLKKLGGIVQDRKIARRLKCFPIAVNGSDNPSDMRSMDLVDGTGGVWLHDNKSGKAIDGFFGYEQDNLDTELKHFDWSTILNSDNRTAAYFEELYKSNFMKYQKMEEGSFHKMELKDSLDSLQILMESNLNVRI